MRIATKSLTSARTGLILWPALAALGFVAWMLLPEIGDADDHRQPTPARAVSLQTVTTPTSADSSPADPMIAAALAIDSLEPAEQGVDRQPADGLKILGQSWRRGGLGSKAIVRFTLRNSNNYPVKDVEIACSFARRDGSHLTDRKRVIADTINTRSRKTYSGMLIGFVNINANKAKCLPVTANRA